jgi:ABC-type molybdenum transport system ATPase subunit/photorepair protein PhrA
VIKKFLYPERAVVQAVRIWPAPAWSSGDLPCPSLWNCRRRVLTVTQRTEGATIRFDATKRRSAELLARFDLADAAGRSVKTYSGRMRRRLDLAASLVQRPAVLFLDEPTTGLDPRSRGEVWAMIRELVAEGTTVLLTTQYLDEADRDDHGRFRPLRRHSRPWILPIMILQRV